MRPNTKLHAALTRLAGKFEYGELMAETQPAAFIDSVVERLDDLEAKLREAEKDHAIDMERYATRADERIRVEMQRAEKAEREMVAILDTMPADVVVRACECSGPSPVAAALAASVSKLRLRMMTAEVERNDVLAAGRGLMKLVIDFAPYPPEVAEAVLSLVASARAALGEKP